MKLVNLRRQLGFTAIEMMVVLIVAMGALTMGGTAINTYTDNLANQAAADHAKQVRDGAQRYVKDNYAAILAVATPAAPASITVAMLQATNYLPASFTATNGFGQSYSILALEPVAGQLQTLIVTTGGETIAELGIRRIAQLIGAQGGYVSSVNTAVAAGSYGGWATALPGNYGVTPGAGHLAIALFFADSGTVSDYLYRNLVTGHPELNTMNVPLIMASVQTSGNACATTGSIARDVNGAVLSCQSGTWKAQGGAGGVSYWGDPVTTYGVLPACVAGIAWQTRIVETPGGGSGPRAYTCDGSSWQALAVDNNGNLTVAGTLTASTVNAGTVNATTGNITTVNASALNGTNASISSTATINALAGNLQITPTVAEGGGCAPDGRLAMSNATSGLLLSCQSGTWKKQASGAGYDSLQVYPTVVGRFSFGNDFPGAALSDCIALGAGWRVPSFSEASYLLLKGRMTPYPGSGSFWTANASSNGYFSIGFSSGNVIAYDNSGGSLCYVLCVK